MKSLFFHIIASIVLLGTSLQASALQDSYLVEIEHTIEKEVTVKQDWAFVGKRRLVQPAQAFVPVFEQFLFKSAILPSTLRSVGPEHLLIPIYHFCCSLLL